MADLELDFWGRVQSGYYQAEFLKFDYEEYEEELLEQLNSIPLTNADYDLALEKIKGSVKDLKRHHLQQYRNEESRRKHQFYKDCEKEFGFADFPEEVKNFIHGKAYEEGYAYGFSEIADKYDDLVEFVNVCKEALKNE